MQQRVKTRAGRPGWAAATVVRIAVVTAAAAAAVGSLQLHLNYWR
jgi:hypothetical protein